MPEATRHPEDRCPENTEIPEYPGARSTLLRSPRPEPCTASTPVHANTGSLGKARLAAPRRIRAMCRVCPVCGANISVRIEVTYMGWTAREWQDLFLGFFVSLKVYGSITSACLGCRSFSMGGTSNDGMLHLPPSRSPSVHLMFLAC